MDWLATPSQKHPEGIPSNRDQRRKRHLPQPCGGHRVSGQAYCSLPSKKVARCSTDRSKTASFGGELFDMRSTAALRLCSSQISGYYFVLEGVSLCLRHFWEPTRVLVMLDIHE